MWNTSTAMETIIINFKKKCMCVCNIMCVKMCVCDIHVRLAGDWCYSLTWSWTERSVRPWTMGLKRLVSFLSPALVMASSTFSKLNTHKISHAHTSVDQ